MSVTTSQTDDHGDQDDRNDDKKLDINDIPSEHPGTETSENPPFHMVAELPRPLLPSMTRTRDKISSSPIISTQFFEHHAQRIPSTSIDIKDSFNTVYLENCQNINNKMHKMHIMHSCTSTSRWFSRTSSRQLRKMVPKMECTSNMESSTSAETAKTKFTRWTSTSWITVYNLQEEGKTRKNAMFQTSKCSRMASRSKTTTSDTSKQKWRQGVPQQDSKAHLYQRYAQAIAQAERHL